MVCSTSSVPTGWTRHVHPEGQPYYFKTRGGRTYMTDTDITKLENLDTMQRHVDDMETRISTHANVLPEEFQIYLEHRSSFNAAYYMVDHDRNHRCVFWIDKLDLREYVGQDLGLHSMSHWRACLHSQFLVRYDFNCRALYAL